MRFKWKFTLSPLLSFIDSVMAVAGHSFIQQWSKVERAYRRPFSAVALRMKFAFYPLLAIGAIAWLGWDWSHSQSLNSAENAVFDSIIKWRPFEPTPSGKVVVIEIDDCSIAYFSQQGEAGWPWPRERHAELLDLLDRAGVKAVGYDILFTDTSKDNPRGDATLAAMAEGGAGRFVFAASRLHVDFDEGSSLLAADAPGALAMSTTPKNNPKVALLLPYAPQLAKYSALTNVSRNQDGVLRDIPLLELEGDWALPALPFRLALNAEPQTMYRVPVSVRPNWRMNSRLPRISAADLITGDEPICRDMSAPLPSLKGRVALIGYTASGLNDTKPTPVDPVMPGVEVLAEATEALIAGSAIQTPPVWIKYAMAALLTLLITFAFFRGEPANDIDSIFVAINVTLLSTSFIGMTYFAYFLDIFSCVAFVSLIFGLCRIYAGVQRGHAVGHNDFMTDFNPSTDRWLVMARLRFVADAHLNAKSTAQARREYRRRLRRFLYAGSDAVMLEGVVERKSWLHESLDDLMVLIWHGETEAATIQLAEADLHRLHAQLTVHDARLSERGHVFVAFAQAEIDDKIHSIKHGDSKPLRELLGKLLISTDERLLAASQQQADVP